MSRLAGWIAALVAAGIAAVVAFGKGQEVRWIGDRHYTMDPVSVAITSVMIVVVVVVAAAVGSWLVWRRPASPGGPLALAIAAGTAAGWVVGLNAGPVYPAAAEHFPQGTLELHLDAAVPRDLSGPVICTAAFERDDPGGAVTSLRAMPLWGDGGGQLGIDIDFLGDAVGGGAAVRVYAVDAEGAWEAPLYDGEVGPGAVTGDPDRRAGALRFTAGAEDGGAAGARGTASWDCRPGTATPPSTPTPAPTAAPPLAGTLTLGGDVAGTFTLAAPACDIVDDPPLGAGEIAGSGTLADGRPARVTLAMGGPDAPMALWGINLRLFVDGDAGGTVFVPADGSPIYGEMTGGWSMTLDGSGSFEGLGPATVTATWGCLEAAPSDP